MIAGLDLDRRRELFRICRSKSELKDWIYFFLDLELPDVIVDPQSNTTPMDMAWDTYAHFTGQITDAEVSRILYYAARDAGKTLTQSVIEVLALLHLDVNVVHLAAIIQQSQNAQKYLKAFLNRSDTIGFLEGNNIRVTEVCLYRPEDPTDDGIVLTEKEWLTLNQNQQRGYYRVQNRAEIIVATMQSTNGLHAGIVCLDEIDVLSNPAAYAESVNIPTAVKRRDGKTQMPLTILTSTRKSAFGLVQDEINKAPLTGLRVKHFNILDVTERCPPQRHRPDLPEAQMWVSTDELRHVDDATYRQMSFKEKESFSLATGFSGCQNCRLFVACRGRLATAQTSTSKFLKPIQHVINQFKNNSIDMAKAQLLCLKPSSTGLVYSRLDRMKHVITPAEAYYKVFGEEVQDPQNFSKAQLMDALAARDVGWFGGLDWGSTHNFAYVHGFKDHNRGFVTHCVSIAELDPDQMLDVCAPFKRFDPQIYPDTADPKMNKLFKKNGYRMMKWKKGPGSVIGGINIVRWMLNPPMGDPNLFIVRDLGDDPQIDLLWDNLSQYHWKLDAARKPTAVPSEDKDDEPDAFRYAIMNVFDPSAGQIVTSTMRTEDTEAQEFSAPGNGGLYDPKHWMTQVISERTGQAPNFVQTRPPMETSKPQSYYGEEVPTKGKKGRLIFDI
jgi:hypothetical protein